MCILVLELFSVQTNMKHNLRSGGEWWFPPLYCSSIMVCVLICPLTHYWPRTWTFMHTRVQASSPCVCMHAHVCRCVYLHCAFAAFEVTQCCVSPSGAFGRLSERWMTAVISTSAPCRLLPLSFLSAPCSISPFLYPSTSPPLLFVSSLPFPPIFV